MVACRRPSPTTVVHCTLASRRSRCQVAHIGDTIRGDGGGNIASEMEPVPLIERPKCHGGCGLYTEPSSPICVGVVCGCIWHAECGNHLKTCPSHTGTRRGVFPVRRYEPSKCVLCTKDTDMPFVCNGWAPRPPTSGHSASCLTMPTLPDVCDMSIRPPIGSSSRDVAG